MCTRALAFAVAAAAVLASVIAVAERPSIKRVPVRYTSPASAQEMYVNYCAACHGQEGRGDGPARPALKAVPTDLTTLARQNGGRYPAAHVYAVLAGKAEPAAHGSKEMPVWGPIFWQLGQGHPAEAQQRAANLTKYIEDLQAR